MSQPPEIPDAKLVQAAQAGDRRALEALLARHAPRVVRFAMHPCRNPHDAEDVVQETLLAATRTLPNFRGASAVPTWLYAIARSFCLKKRRRGRSVTRLDVPVDDAQPADKASQPDERLGDQQMAATLEAAIGHLPPAQREVLLLRDVEGLTAPEVAEALRLRIETVKSRLHRARLAVRAEVAPLLSPPVPEARLRGCPDVPAMYSRYLEGEIGPDACAAMERHLAECPRCTAACDTLRRTLALCQSRASPAVPPSVQALVRRALAQAMATAPTRS